MQARIILLPGSPVGERMCSFAEEVLTDISVAFGHTFSILRDKIGDTALRAYGVPLADGTMQQCAQAGAVFLGDSGAEGEQTLLRALGVPLKMRTFSVGGAGDGHFSVVRAIHDERAAINDMFSAAMKTAIERDQPLYYILPEGEPLRSRYREAVEEANRQDENRSCELDPEEAVERLIAEPAGLGILLGSAYAGNMCLSLATGLHGAPMLLFDQCPGRTVTVYEPLLPDGVKANDELNPLGAISAVAAMLRDSLGLAQEADCVTSAVKNILDAGWRTPDMTSMGDGISSYKMQQLISDQINLAGELLQQHGERQ